MLYYRYKKVVQNAEEIKMLKTHAAQGVKGIIFYMPQGVKDILCTVCVFTLGKYHLYLSPKIPSELENIKDTTEGDLG